MKTPADHPEPPVKELKVEGKLRSCLSINLNEAPEEKTSDLREARTSVLARAVMSAIFPISPLCLWMGDF